jgi:hypothetical protein
MIRPKDIKTAALIVVALLASASATFAAGTPEQRRACRDDAMRLCRKFVPNVKRITACMEANIDKLSPECRKQFK